MRHTWNVKGFTGEFEAEDASLESVQRALRENPPALEPGDDEIVMVEGKDGLAATYAVAVEEDGTVNVWPVVFSDDVERAVAAQEDWDRLADESRQNALAIIARGNERNRTAVRVLVDRIMDERLDGETGLVLVQEVAIELGLAHDFLGWDVLRAVLDYLHTEEGR